MVLSKMSRLSYIVLESVGEDMKWWKTAVIYEIYPKSFNGDIQGIIAKLDYLCDLGIDALLAMPYFYVAVYGQRI